MNERFDSWLKSKSESISRTHPSSLTLQPFSAEQLSSLHLIRDHIATSLSIEPDDSDYAPFSQ